LPNVITANRLTDGIVVYLAADGGWTEDIARERFAETEDETSALEAQANQAVKDRIVVAMYPMPVEIKDGAVDPLSVREKIRAAHRTTLTKDWYDVPL
jgi:sulfite reductase (NADPH) hemoprotein beta-component